MKATLIFCLLFCSTLALAQPPTEFSTPRGANIETPTGHCGLGPFGQDGNTHHYEGLCHRLTTSEKCFAYLKQHLRDDGRMIHTLDTAKATFCMQTLKKALLGQMQ